MNAFIYIIHAYIETDCYVLDHRWYRRHHRSGYCQNGANFGRWHASIGMYTLNHKKRDILFFDYNFG